ncbi:MAG: hypothetical protein JXQ23_06235, partial [Clostridia bacterium]|nr:hypothetical protein [Clostridia bacterium]
MILFVLLLFITGCKTVEVVTPVQSEFPEVSTFQSEPAASEITQASSLPSPTETANPDENLILLNKLNSEQVIMIKVIDENDFHATL